MQIHFYIRRPGGSRAAVIQPEVFNNLSPEIRIRLYIKQKRVNVKLSLNFRVSLKLRPNIGTEIEIDPLLVFSDPISIPIAISISAETRKLSYRLA
jgi:hypothetical protein